MAAPSTYPQRFAIDQSVTAFHREGDETFRAVVEKADDRLVMVGLAPHGGRGFSITQEGETIEFENHLSRDLPFPARYMVIDLQRTWLVGLAEPMADGEHRSRIDGELRTDTWADGLLVSRAFERPGFDGTIRIRYEPGLAPDFDRLPDRVELDNPWFGYRLVIESIHAL